MNAEYCALARARIGGGKLETVSSACEKITQKMTREGAVEVNAQPPGKRTYQQADTGTRTLQKAPQPPEQAAQTIPGGAA